MTIKDIDQQFMKLFKYQSFESSYHFDIHLKTDQCPVWNWEARLYTGLGGHRVFIYVAMAVLILKSRLVTASGCIDLYVLGRPRRSTANDSVLI
jgi:hypothetical protein